MSKVINFCVVTNITVNIPPIDFVLPYTSGDYRTLFFADKIVTTMFDAYLWDAVKSYLAKCIYKCIDCRHVPDDRAIGKCDTQALCRIVHVLCWHMRVS